MTDKENRKFELHLPGLLKVLAEHLYSTRQVAIRELIQNAHDSCIRRVVEGNEGPTYEPKILISTDHANKVLVINDNGSGLTSDEIKMYLATIGRSYTRELNKRIEILSPTHESDLIGQFGLGFLSSFLVASEVNLNTKSLIENSKALSWQSSGDEYYQLTPGPNKEVGTELRLKLKPDSTYLLEEQILIDTIRKYADFLSIPIYLGDNPVPINLMYPPWEAKDVISATKDYIARRFDNNNPIWIIPIKNHTINLGHDTIDVPLKGFLYVPSSSIASVREYGDLTIYIKHMFICDNERELLPSWARFVRGVIDSPYLQPIASREGLHQNSNFDVVQEALEIQLINEFKSLSENSPDIWKSIVRGHSDIIVGWAVTEDSFFEQVAHIVMFRTSRGILNLSEYLKLTNSTLYYVSREMGSLQEQLLGEGYDVPVIDASWFAVKPFLEKYVSWHPEIILVQMDGQSKQLLRPIPQNTYGSILTYYKKRGINARVAAYKPVDVPGLILHAEDAEWLIEAHEALDSGEISGPLAELVDEYLSKRMSEMIDDDIKGILYLNDSCSLVRQLRDNPVPEIIRNTILDVIYHTARLFAGRTMKPTDVVMSFHEIVISLQKLINQ